MGGEKYPLMHMKLSKYKKKMVIGFVLSLVSMGIGALLLTYFVYPVFGVPFMLFGGFSSFYFLIYLVGEYEEDLADSRTVSDIANGYVNGLKVKSKK